MVQELVHNPPMQQFNHQFSKAMELDHNQPIQAF